MITEITTSLAALKHAKDLLKLMIESHDQSVREAEAFKIRNLIVEVQESLILKTDEISAAKEEIRQLKEEIRNMVKWDTEKSCYTLKEINPGSYAYIIKEPKDETEQFVKFCTNCFEKKHRSILQLDLNVAPRRLACPICKTHINASR